MSLEKYNVKLLSITGVPSPINQKFSKGLPMKRAVCVLIHESNGSGRVLATSRRNDNTQWGFPGGKVDPGESDVQAAVRELKEETGLTVPVSSLVPVYCDETTGFICTTFLVTTSVYGSIVAEKGIEVATK